MGIRQSTLRPGQRKEIIERGSRIIAEMGQLMAAGFTYNRQAGVMFYNTPIGGLPLSHPEAVRMLDTSRFTAAAAGGSLVQQSFADLLHNA